MDDFRNKLVSRGKETNKNLALKREKIGEI